MVIDYCLMTTDQILKFLFRVIDTNDDEIISKKDILKFFAQKTEPPQQPAEQAEQEQPEPPAAATRRIFPINYLKLIETLEIERSDYIPKHEFIKVVYNVPFLVYPAVRLQEDMRQLIIGEKFWRQ